MLTLSGSAQAWGTHAFEVVLKRELADQLDALPLQAALSQGNRLADTAATFMLLDARIAGEDMHLRIGVQFQSVIAGCSCADDPTPDGTLEEYCQLHIRLDRSSGAATAEVIAD